MSDLSISVMSWPNIEGGIFALFRTPDGKWLFEGRGETNPVTSETVREWFREQNRKDLLEKYFGQRGLQDEDIEHRNVKSP